MRATWLGMLAVLAALPAAAGEMPWAKDFESAQAQAAVSGRLIMIDFYADW